MPISLNYPVPSGNHFLSKINENNSKIQNALNNYILQENVTFYVTTAGSDTTGDGTSSKPYATIQKAVDAIPKNLNGFIAFVNIGSGTYTENLLISGFNSGALSLLSTSSVNVTIKGITTIKHCTYVFTSTFLPLIFSNINGIPLTISNSHIRFDANTVIIGSSSYSGLLLDNMSDCKFGNLTINNCNVALELTRLSRIFITALAGSGNSVGISGNAGSITSYATNTITATTEKTLNAGAIITNLLTMS